MTVRDYLMGIYEKHGQLTPELVVRVARPEKHPLHAKVYDRAPAAAAEAWYRHRAHELIQSAKIIYREADEDGPERSLRAFVCTRTEAGHVYEPSEKVAADPFLRQLVLRDMEREWKQLYARYGDFEEFVRLVTGDISEVAA